MALQTSGAISLNDLATEFGGNTPHAINEYYRGGGLVPDTGTNSGIPTSGQIDLNDFYGGDVTTGATNPPSGSLYVWGASNNKFDGAGFLGRGADNTTNYSSPVQTLRTTSNWLGGPRACFSMGMGVSGGQIWSWAGSNAGQAKLAACPTNTSSPRVAHGGSTGWIMVEANYQAVATGIKDDGRLWTWGDDTGGLFGGHGRNQVGLDNTSPAQTLSGGTDWTQSRWFLGPGGTLAGTQGVRAGKTDGRLWGWGNNRQGQLGIGSQGNLYSSPIQIGHGGGTAATNWTAVGGCAGVKSDGRLWVWAQNTSGVLGRNQSEAQLSESNSPAQTVAGGTTWVHCLKHTQVAAATKSDGRMWGWGYAYNAGHGLDNLVDTSSPKQFPGSHTTWEGYNFTMNGGLHTDGKLWVWGPNFEGQLCPQLTGWVNPASAPGPYTTSPLQIGTSTNWTQQVGGGTTRHAIKS